MSKNSKPRAGSLQFWPRKRASKKLPSVNWVAANKGKKGLLGFIGYKVGMTSVLVKDTTDDSRTKNKRIIVPGTIIECPEMKIFSVRFYQGGKVKKDVVVNFEKSLKKVVKKPKVIKKLDDEIKDLDYDDVRVVVYSGVDKTGIQNKADVIELGLNGSKDEKLNFIKEKIGKGILISEIFSLEDKLVDVRGLTKGKGLVGPVKRFGISLKSHKSEKGVRRPGTLAPWHPARVTFRAPLAGQLGMFSRVIYNNVLLKIGKISEENINKDFGFHKYGKIKTDFLILKGSLPGPRKRVLLITPAQRPTKKQVKQKLEVVELR